MKRWLSAPYQNFYRTAAQPCPYIDGRSERKIITELSGPLAIPVYNELSRAGFRRSHSLAYRPACELCSACLPARIVADAFEPGRSARRLARINADLTIEAGHSLATEEQYSLFSRYQQARHGDSDMAGMNFIEYRAMIEDSPLETMLVSARDKAGRLVAACLADRLDDGWSAVYSFFEPDEPRRGLGTWLVLQLVELARARRLPYVYLGYWIEGSAKMDYKIRFRPLEVLGPTGWHKVRRSARPEPGAGAP